MLVGVVLPGNITLGHFLGATRSVVTSDFTGSGPQESSSRSRIRCSQGLYVFSLYFLEMLCNFCVMHPGRLKTGLLDSPGDLFMV